MHIKAERKRLLPYTTDKGILKGNYIHFSFLKTIVLRFVIIILPQSYTENELLLFCKTHTYINILSRIKNSNGYKLRPKT